MGQIEATQRTLLGIDAAVGVLMLLLLGLVAASVVRLGLAPLTAMQSTARAIAAGDLSRRVDDPDPHTETGRLGLAFNAMLTQIESALAARTASERRLRQFLADASHELRTPLTSIQGFAELYRRGGAPPGPALDEAMTRIEAEASRMAVLVGDLLALARLDEERPLERHPVDLLAIAADAVRDAHARVPDRFVSLDCDWPEDDDEPPTVSGDEARLRQVVTNLLANALQHTPSDVKITVRISRGTPIDLAPVVAAVGTEPDGPTAVLEVADTGPGIPAQQAERVFERLYRADPSRQRASGGAGLGLAIVAAIVTAHGGRVELRTIPTAGATFRVVLPASP
jgi:two-component system OmpR family sensor kinase